MYFILNIFCLPLIYIVLMKFREIIKNNPIIPLSVLFLFFGIVIKTLGITLPFLLAYIFALAVNSLAKKLTHSTFLNNRTAAVIIAVILLSFLLLALYCVAKALCSQALLLCKYIIANRESIEARAGELSEKISNRLNFINPQKLNSGIFSLAGDAVSKIGKFSLHTAKSIPQTLLSVGVFFCSLFYFTADFSSVNRFLSDFLPGNVKSFIAGYGKNSKTEIVGCVKGYFILFLLTVCELFLLFCAVCLPVPLLLAFAVALFDILPVFGVGTVLIPYALFCFFSGRIAKGTVLFFGFLFITSLRSFAEPKIISSKIGVHPLVMIFSAYLFFVVYGTPGVIFAPFFVIIAKILFFDKNRDIQM